MKWFKYLLTCTSAQLKEKRDQSRSWTTCAVGEFQANFPNIIRKSLWGPYPSDSKLKDLGITFDKAIIDGDKKVALSIYRQIERRVITLAQRG